MYCRNDQHPPTVCHSGAEAANLVLTEDNPAVSALACVVLNMPICFGMHLTRRKDSLLPSTRPVLIEEGDQVTGEAT